MRRSIADRLTHRGNHSAVEGCRGRAHSHHIAMLLPTPDQGCAQRRVARGWLHGPVKKHRILAIDRCTDLSEGLYLIGHD